MTRFSSYQVWDNVLPPYLALRSSSKGDDVGGRKHLAGVMHHRDPMRCAISMIGMNFAYQFFELQIELPSLDQWLETMHKIPLIRLRSGRGVHTTEYNSFLRQDLELIGAKYSDFTLHGIRNQRIGEAHEDPNMRGDAIMNGVGHSTGSHFDNYKGCLETSYMLNSVGYHGTDPQILASHVETLLEYMYERQTEATELVNVLYQTLRPELLNLENAAANDTSEAGHRVREFLHYVRHSMLAWIVSTTARPRTRDQVSFKPPPFVESILTLSHSSTGLGLIDTDRQQKRFLVAAVYTRHLKCLVSTSQYTALQDIQRRREEYEISLGELAQCGAQERRNALRMTSQFQKLPQQLAECIQPQFASLSHDLCDESQLRLDSDYFYSLSLNERESFTIALLDGAKPIGTAQLRKARLDSERRKADVRRDFNGGMLKWIKPSTLPPASAGLASPRSQRTLSVPLSANFASPSIHPPLSPSPAPAATAAAAAPAAAPPPAVA